VLVPAYLVLLRRSRDEVGALAWALAVPGLAAVAAVAVGMAAADRVDDALLGGLLAGAVTFVLYMATTFAWVRPRWRAARTALDGPDESPDDAPEESPDLAPVTLPVPQLEPPEPAVAHAVPAARPRGTTP
jgi:hypothetical protein